jgi:hypothetical protein
MASNNSHGPPPPPPPPPPPVLPLPRAVASDVYGGGRGIGRIVYNDAMDMILLVAVNTTGAHVAKYGEAATCFEEVQKICIADPAYSRCGALTRKSVWDRFKKLKAEFLERERKNRNASGIDEEVTEKDDLLADICEQIEDARLEIEKAGARKRKREQDLIDAGKTVRNRALKRMKRRMNDSCDDYSDVDCPSPPSRSTRNGIEGDEDDAFGKAFEAAASRHAEITGLRKDQLQLNKQMLELEEQRLEIQKDEYARSERRFNIDEERLRLENNKFEHQKDQDRFRMELERKERESTLKLVSALANKLLQ